MEALEITLANALVKILEKEHLEFIFGYPGEQILPFYQALQKSNIKHILTRHEQGAVHAADGYARASHHMSVCVAAAGPGALNMVMGVATAYKDSIPMLVITGDVPLQLKGENVFQDVDINSVFAPITLQSHLVTDPERGILITKKAISDLKTGKTGPIHLNFPKDVLQMKVDPIILEKEMETSPNTDWVGIDRIKMMVERSYKPLILAGAGVIWSHATTYLQEFAEKNQIPVATTYPARGIISEENPLSLGLIGLRGTEAANFAGKNSDLILALGCRLSERTRKGLGSGTLIQVNLDERVLGGDVNIRGDVKEFLDKIKESSPNNTEKWLKEIQSLRKIHQVETNFKETPIRPQRAIKEILDAMGDSILVNDAGSHTTWVNLIFKAREPSSLLFSGGFGPMGYGVPAAIGVSLAHPSRSVVVVVGDGGLQMNIQELATIAELDLPITICLLNNQSLGIIRQWQDLYYSGSFQVELENPDFVQLAEAYHIKALRVDSPGDVFEAVQKAVKLNKPVFIEIEINENEDIPLPG